MGLYEHEQWLIENRGASRGHVALDYLIQLDMQKDGFNASHRPRYEKTLFAPECDDIYRELCAYLDMPEPRSYVMFRDPISVEGYTAQDVYDALTRSRVVADVDAVTVYNMLARLRVDPKLAKATLRFDTRHRQYSDQVRWAAAAALYPL